MKTTEHYSLPQWEATDALKRSDFNAAMESIDTAVKQVSEAAEQSQTAHESGDAQLWNGLLQMGELYLRQQYDAMDETALTEGNGLLLNPLSSVEMAQSLTQAQWDGEQKVYIGRAEEVPRTFLRSYCTGYAHANVSTSYKDVTATYEFTSPVNGRVTDFDLRYYLFFDEPYTAFTGGILTFTAYEKQDGSYVSIYTKSGIPFEKSGTTTVQDADVVSIDVPLKSGCNYQFALHLESGQGILGRLGFSTDTESDNSQFTVSIDPATGGTHARSLTARRATTHAIVFAEYQQEENSGSVVVSVDGGALTERERTTVQGDSAVTHTVVCTGTVPAGVEHTLSFALTCSGTDRLCLNKYGVYLM